MKATTERDLSPATPPLQRSSTEAVVRAACGVTSQPCDGWEDFADPGPFKSDGAELPTIAILPTERRYRAAFALPPFAHTASFFRADDHALDETASVRQCRPVVVAPFQHTEPRVSQQICASPHLKSLGPTFPFKLAGKPVASLPETKSPTSGFAEATRCSTCHVGQMLAN